MEMEGECLLDSEMLGEERAEQASDEVSSILMDGGEEVSDGPSCIPSAMDFEFTNSDLGSTSDFSIDHSSMFDISESVIDEKGDCGYLFKDSSIFEDVHVKQSGEIDGLSTVSCTNKKTSICNDLGLRLQIIPLNNLQFVSTIQTSEGLHILAVPAGSNLSIIPQISSLLAGSQAESIVPHTTNHINFSVNENTPDLSCSLSTADCQRSSQDGVSSVSNVTESETDLSRVVETDHLQVKKKPVVVSSKAHRRVPTSQLSRAQLSSFPAKLKPLDGKRHLTQKGKVCKESKIVIDLRKLAQTRKKQMVSLLNNPRTKSLLHLHSQKVETDGEDCLKSVIKQQQVKDATITELDNCLNHSPSEENTKEDAVNAQTADVKISKTAEIKINKTADIKISKTAKKKRSKRTNSQSDEKEEVVALRLKQHTSTVSDKNSMRRNFTCEVCFSKFNREGNYKNHVLLHENSNIYSLENKLEMKNTTETDLENKLEMKNATEIDLENKSEMKKTTENGLGNILEMKYMTETETLQNESSVRGEGNAEATDNSADQESNAESVETLGETTVQLRCELCSMIFSTEGNLTRHKLTHSVSSKSELRFSCAVCKRSFLQRCDLKRHQSTHTGQYPYTCSICNKGFIRRSDLTVHERFHLKEKTFRCDLCSKTYYQSGDLHRHIRRSHSNKCDYTCTQCNRKYSTQKSLNQHLTKHLRQRT